MNQPIRLKRNNQTLPCFKSEYHTNIASRRNSKTPQLCRPTSQNKFKKKKTPIKICVNQKVIQKTQLSIKDKSIKSLNKSEYQQQTLSQIEQVKISNIKCKKCDQYQKRQKQLLQRLEQYQRYEKEFQSKFQQLKQEYEKKLRKYKVKSRIQKDQLKLLKWILSQRKEFHQILQKLQKMKEKGVRPLDQYFAKQNQNQQEICLTDRTIPKQAPKKQKLQNQIEHKVKSQKISNIEIKALPIQTFQKNHKNQVIKVPTQREVQMFNHINVLEQRVMQLTIRNDFLEKIKLKQNQEAKSKTCSNESISFTKDFMIPKNEDKNSQSRSFWQQDCMNNYQYSDDEQFVQRFQGKEYQVQNQLFDSLHRKKFQVESRYISPLKERINDSNRKQTLNEFYKKEDQKSFDYAPQSRSKYYESIRERSRLLGI